MITLGPATSGDFDAIEALHAGGFDAPWSRGEFEKLMAGPGVFLLKAEEKGGAGLVGFVLARIVADEAEILTITVSSAMRGARIGQRLMEAAAAEAMALGAKSLFLEVAEDNEPALALYRRMGFRELGRRNDYYARGKSRIAGLTMGLTLA